jgi:plastocyanin
MKKNWLGLALGLAVITLSGCTLPGQSTSTPSPIPSPQAATPSPAADLPPLLQGDKVELTAQEFSFNQSVIRVKKGQPLLIAVTNKGGFHDFVIDELRVNSGIIPEGQTKEIAIPTDTVGQFAYYCSISNHRSRGMVGTLIVEEP